MSASTASLPNGILPPTLQQPFNEASEYEKILRIRDEVFSGSHARLTVPAHALRVASSQTPLAVSQSRFNIPSPFPTSASPNRSAAAQLRREEDNTQAQTRADGVPVPSSQPGSNVSEFDPVLLTKSDDLVRAEIQLKRQRLEKALRDQFEQKRLDARKKPAPSEAKPDFDLPAILAKVLESAKPLSPKNDADASDSNDANSFYSSRAPDSTPEHGPRSPSAEEGEAYELPGLPAVSAVMGSPLQDATEDEVPTNNATFAIPAATTSKPSTLANPTAMDLDDEEEEGEYSPPEALAHYPTPNVVHSQAMQDSRDPRNRPLRRYSELDDQGRRPGSPSEANMRIVRNQITSPIAPVPSRVSPLAVAKGAPFLQNGRQRRSPRNGRAGSPPSPDDSQQPNPRKKRKVEKRNEKKARRNGKVSPDAFLKEEQVSPPPFHDVQPLGSGRLRPTGGADQPIALDEETMPEARFPPAPERYVDSPSRPLPRHVEQLMPLSEPRASSRAGLRAGRDEPDLRRVASMHNMRAEGSREYIDPYYDSPTRVRATSTSYARMGSPAIRESSRLAPLEYEQSPREVRVMRTPAPVYREMYEEGEPTIRYGPEPMPPPPTERIVIDQYGRRFREIIQERPSVAPRATPIRRTEVEPGYEHYRAARAGSVFLEAGPERSYASDMPPPPVTYRRPIEATRSSAYPPSASREYLEPGSLARSSSVQVPDRAPRSTIFPDEHPDFREPLRMGSVRPTTMRYEEPQPVEMMTRAQSVRPVVRERSVFVESRGPVGHRYLPAEEPRYRVMEPDVRYLDAPDREMEEMVDPMEGPRRVMERY